MVKIWVTSLVLCHGGGGVNGAHDQDRGLLTGTVYYGGVCIGMHDESRDHLTGTVSWRECVLECMTTVGVSSLVLFIMRECVLECMIKVEVF